jgi:Zinc finger, C2H2 type
MSNKSKTVKKPFVCDKCKRGFAAKHHLDKHNNRKIPCDVVFNCPKCHKTFPNGSELHRHMKRITPCVPDSVPIVTNNNEENKCHMCGNEYANAYNLRRHQKTCSVFKNPDIMMKILAEMSELKAENSQLRQNQTQPQTVINGDVNIQNTVENNMYVNVTICSFGNEDLSKLDSSKVMNLLKNHAQDFVPKMIEHVHANPEMPEYHNIFYDPVKEKAIVFAPISPSEKSWQEQDFREISSQLTQKIKEHVRPGTGPYFDQAMQAKDSETSNSIIRIVNNVDWERDEIIEKNKDSLTQVSKNKEFLKLVAEV